jgi:hypothetical protein
MKQAKLITSMSHQQGAPSMGSTITISKRPYHINVSIMSILWLYHQAQPSLGIIKHHGSKAIIKQSSSCQATITMSSNHQATTITE